MELKSVQGQGIYYDLFNQNHKFYFAIYFNIARHNIYITLNNIYRLVYNKEIKTDEDEITGHPIIQRLQETSDMSSISHIIKLLERWMPFATYKLEEHPVEIAKRMKNFFQFINEYRNYYSHYENKPLNRNLFLGDFNKRDHLHYLKEGSNKKLAFRFKDHAISQGIAWENVENLINRYLKKSIKLSGEDIIFILSLFLEKGDVHNFINNIKGFKSTTQEYRYIREFFCCFCMKLPSPKIKSGDPKESLMLRMINELNRCPESVYKYLNDKGRKLVLSSIEMVENDDRTFLRPIELRRYDDRFTFFALQYIEHKKLYPGMQFNLNLGKKYIKKPYEKTVHESTFEREITKDILCFGRLSDTDPFKEYEKYYKESEEGILTYTYPLKQLNPHYFISRKRLGLKFSDDSNLPDITIPTRTENNVPDCYISEWDIIYLAYLGTQVKDRDALNAMKRLIAHRRRFLEDFNSSKISEINEDVLNKYTHKAKWIPSIIRDYLNNEKKPDLKSQIERKLKEEIEEVEFLQEKYAKGYQAQKGEKLMKSGELAQWLSKDIVRLSPPREVLKNGKVIIEKLSSAEYDVLQYRLAYFGKQDEEFFKGLFQELGLTVNRDTQHPFLYKVRLRTEKTRLGIKGFFNRYLEKKLDWLNAQIKDIPQDVAMKDYYYLNLQKDHNREEAKAYAQQIINEPVFIPRGFFRQFMPNDNSIVYELDQEPHDGAQWFYDADFHLELAKSPENKKSKEMRFELAKDRVLWKMIKHMDDSGMLSEVFDQTSLSEYHKPGEDDSNNILDSIAPIHFRIDGKEIRMNRKIKDYGKSVRFLKDKRIPGLLSFYIESSIKVEDLRNELLYYKKLQQNILPYFYKIEKKVIQKYPGDVNNRKKDGYINFEEVLKIILSDEKLIEEIKTYRNKLMHNQVPMNENLMVTNGEILKELEKIIESKVQELTGEIKI